LKIHTGWSDLSQYAQASLDYTCTLHHRYRRCPSYAVLDVIPDSVVTIGLLDYVMSIIPNTAFMESFGAIF